ncbi:hypothetical protein GOL41_10585 [Sinorhizobium medicae]|nr:hypothetical protein [Sinorhizobium medicae]MDX1050214.1 hypothetical protein [Sinorhizobium medicae]
MRSTTWSRASSTANSARRRQSRNSSLLSKARSKACGRGRGDEGGAASPFSPPAGRRCRQADEGQPSTSET